MIRKSPPPLFVKEGLSSLWKREVGRDFVIVGCSNYYETINKDSEGIVAQIAACGAPWMHKVSDKVTEKHTGSTETSLIAA